jgi:hypothetical protein
MTAFMAEGDGDVFNIHPYWQPLLYTAPAELWRMMVDDIIDANDDPELFKDHGPIKRFTCAIVRVFLCSHGIDRSHTWCPDDFYVSPCPRPQPCCRGDS